MQVINPYVQLMKVDFSQWSFEEEAPQWKGQWRGEVFGVSQQTPLDLEIGTGNGFYFAHYVNENPDRCVVGLELKFKTLVQSIRRALRGGAKNARMVRWNASKLDELFGEGELNNVFIHFPDPWPKKRQNKNRLINTEFLKMLHGKMKPGCQVEFKTDHYGYFCWAREYFKKSPFKIKFYTEDLHNSSRKDKNFVTHFESLFLKKQQPIFYCLLEK